MANTITPDTDEGILVQHARRELAKVGNGHDFDEKIVEMVRTFSQMGHSGSSAFYTVELIKKLLSFENISPITDNPEDWQEIQPEMSGVEHGIWQCRRNGALFSDDGGKTYYSVNEGAHFGNPYPRYASVKSGLGEPEVN